MIAPMPADPGWDSTLTLLTRAREGDSSALNVLFSRYIPPLRRWASGRLPRFARDMADTQDLVQDVVIQAFKRIDAFDHRGEGAFQAYLRRSLINRIRDELRRNARQPAAAPVGDDLPDDGVSPIEAAIGNEALERYESALKSLSDDDQQLVIGRTELGLTYLELAQMTGRHSPDAARMAVSRALLRLAEAMGPS